jgi:hypothetical protein
MRDLLEQNIGGGDRREAKCRVREVLQLLLSMELGQEASKR